jgi:glycosyltransferase involved in cell wall biosynthesis
VAVIVPAFNAAETLADTLDSVIGQSHRCLDIVVVDDGSTDGTRQIALDYARKDSRVRVIAQPNGGVARARNAGVAATSAEFIAPIDADDLWHPDKICLQLEVMLESDHDIGFVYAPYRQIDEAGNHLGINSLIEKFEGWVFYRHLLVNFVGNGSALLMRRAAFEQAGGYDTSLFDRGLQGAEDWLLQALIARHWRVGAVPMFLVGYRQHAGSMSADRPHMLRAVMASLALVADHCPDTPDWLLRQQHAWDALSLFWHSLKASQYKDAAAALAEAVRAAPLSALDWFFFRARLAIGRRLGLIAWDQAGISPKPFLDMHPTEGTPGTLDKRTLSLLRRLAAMEGPPRRAAGATESRVSVPEGV